MPVFIPDSSSNVASAAFEGMSMSRAKERQRRPNPELPENQSADFASMLIQASELGGQNVFSTQQAHAVESLISNVAPESTPGQPSEGHVDGKLSVVSNTDYPRSIVSQNLISRHPINAAQMPMTSENGMVELKGIQNFPEEAEPEVIGDTSVERAALWSEDLIIEAEAESAVHETPAAASDPDGKADLDAGDTATGVFDGHESASGEFDLSGAKFKTTLNADGSLSIGSNSPAGMQAITGTPTSMLTEGFSADLRMPLSSQLSTAVVLLARGDEIQDRLRGQDVDVSDIEFFRSEFAQDGFHGQSGQRHADRSRTTSQPGRRINRFMTAAGGATNSTASDQQSMNSANGFGFRA